MPPRPRPRPRPVAKATTSSSSVSSPAELLETSKKKASDDDEDSFFMHNQGRSLREVEERAAKVATMISSASEDESSSDKEGNEDTASEDGTPRPSRRSKKLVSGKRSDASKWINQNTIAELLRKTSDKADVIDLSSEDDGNDSYQVMLRQAQAKRARSRSRSLTPPPELTEQERLRTQMAIRRVLQAENVVPARRDPELVNVVEDVDMDPGEEPIDPSLRRIIERVGNRNLNKPSLDSDEASASLVTIRVKWIYPSNLQQSQPAWVFNIKKTDSLRQIAESISRGMGVLPQDLVLLQNRKHVYTTISPQGLGIWDEFDLEACLKSTYEAMNTRSNIASTPPPQSHEDEGNSERGGSPASEASTMDDSDEKFKLIVRASNLSIPLSVRPSTTCGKIVKAFLAVMVKEKGLTIPPKKASQVRLYVDGEKQNPDAPISDCDLEDGDIVEIIGL